MHSDKSRKKKAPSPIENEEGRKEEGKSIRDSCQLPDGDNAKGDGERKSGNEQEEGKNGRRGRRKG